ncbi:Hypothetical_protein [Hexamita inflata]|uniref:Hypothetical_protein n=1 Tax=Hexamita inflata TaxID=28002 RepID=A0AA86QZQ2_9EUKA|nr:Hypothetical protein HINF_LOCUS47800 [Hexamita inflata]
MPAYQGQPEADLKPLVIGYTFILNVLNKNVKSKLIYFCANEKNNQEVAEVLNLIKIGCGKLKQRFRCYVGDCDTKFVKNFITGHVHNNQQLFWQQLQFQISLKLINRLVIGCHDRYHLLKAIRNNLVLGPLVFDISERKIDGCNIIDIEDFIEVLQLALPFKFQTLSKLEYYYNRFSNN